MKLFEIADAIEEILAREVDQETGEITDETLARLDALEMERDQVALSVAAYVKGELAEANAIKDTADGLLARGQRHARRAKRLTEYLARYCEPGKKLEDENAEITWRWTPYAVEIVEERLVPDAFRTEVVTEKIDKAAIKRASKDEPIPGTRLVREQRIYIS